MKRLLFLSVLSIILFSCGQNMKEAKEAKITNYVSSERSKYPTFERLIYELDSMCDFDLDPNYRYDFAKKPDGYYFQIFDFNSKDKSYMNFGTLVKSIKVYDVVDKKMTLKGIDGQFKVYNSRSNYSFITRHLSNFNKKKFDFHLFCNYPEKSKDVRAFYENKANPSDEDLEVLTRSLDIFKLLQNNYDEQMSDSVFLATENFINEVSEYREKIINRNPNYESHIFGDMSVKMSHDWTGLALDYFYMYRKGEVVKCLNQAGYTDAAINYGKFILEQCEKGSLLITNGDSDYYLTFYVQQVLGYRKDVRLVNSSLLQIPGYVRAIQKHYNLKLNLDLNKEESEYLLYINPISNEKGTLISDFNTMQNGSSYGPYKVIEYAPEVLYKGQKLEFKKDKYLTLAELFVFDYVQNHPESSVYNTSEFMLPFKGVDIKGTVFELSNSYNIDSVSISEIIEKLSVLNYETYTKHDYRLYSGFFATLYKYCAPHKFEELVKIVDAKIFCENDECWVVIEKIFRLLRDERIAENQENSKFLSVSLNSILGFVESMKFSPKSIYKDVGSLRYIISRMDNPNMNLTSNEYSKLLSETSSKIKEIVKKKMHIVAKEDYPLTYQELKGLIN
jgi:hypothetical protein